MVQAICALELRLWNLPKVWRSACDDAWCLLPCATKTCAGASRFFCTGGKAAAGSSSKQMPQGPMKQNASSGAQSGAPRRS